MNRNNLLLYLHLYDLIPAWIELLILHQLLERENISELTALRVSYIPEVNGSPISPLLNFVR